MYILCIMISAALLPCFVSSANECLRKKINVCGTRSSMLAGLSCTKGVWYIYDWDTGSSILIW